MIITSFQTLNTYETVYVSLQTNTQISDIEPHNKEQTIVKTHVKGTSTHRHKTLPPCITHLQKRKHTGPVTHTLKGNQTKK